MNYRIMGENVDSPRMRKQDRILVLKVIDGEKPKSYRGLTDSRVFSGGNRLHAIQDSTTSLWYLKYDEGGVPEVLKQHFTNFNSIYRFAKEYFLRRNIEIAEVID